jgi:hypothetical protein
MIQSVELSISLEDNEVGNLLCLPFEFQEIEVEVEYKAYKGFSGNYFEPSEDPELDIYAVRTLTAWYYNNDRNWYINLTKEQLDILDDYMSREQFNEYIVSCCWDDVECRQADDAAEQAEYEYESKYNYVPYN